MVSEPIELFGPKSMAVEKKPVIGMQKEQQEMKHTRKLRRLKYSCEEVYERMDNGLCIFCDELDTPGHHDLKHKGIQIFMVDDNLASDYIKEFHQSQETVTSPEPIVETAKNLDSFIEPLVHDSVSQALDSVPDMLMVHKVEELPQKSASGSGKKIAHQLFDQMPNEYQKDLTMIESSDKEVLSFSHKDDRVWEPGGLPTKMDLWNWKELKPYGESHKVKSNPEFNTFESNKTFSLEDEHDDETNAETNSLLEKERIHSRALCDQVPATQSQDFNVIQQEKLIHDTETIMEMGPVQEPESLGLTDSIFKVDYVPSQFQVPIPSLEPSCRRQKESLAVINDLSCDLGCVIGKTIGSICDSELGQDNSHDEEELIGLNLGKLLKNERLFSIICLLGLNDMSCWTQLLRQQIFPKSWRFKFKTESSGEAILLKQHDDSVETNLVKFERALSRLSLPVAHALNIFLTNMSFHLASHVRQFDVTTIADTVWIAKRCESSLLQHSSATQSRAPFSPYQSYNDQPYYERKFGECPEIEFDRESDKKEKNSILSGKISVAWARKKCMVSKVGRSTFDLERDQIQFNSKEEFVGLTESSELRPSREFLLMNFGIFMNPQLLHDKRIIQALLVGIVGTKEKLSDRLSLANYVWKPGELLCVQDQWGWINEVHSGELQEWNDVVAGHFLFDMVEKGNYLDKVIEEVAKTFILAMIDEPKDIKTACVFLEMSLNRERLIQLGAPPIFSDLLCIKNRIQGRLKMVLLLEFLWLILFTSKMFKSSNVPQKKSQTDQKLSSFWKLLLSWKISQNIHVSSRCVLRQEESYVKVLELIKDRDSRKRKLRKNWWFKFKLNTLPSETLHWWRKRKSEKLQRASKHMICELVQNSWDMSIFGKSRTWLLCKMRILHDLKDLRQFTRAGIKFHLKHKWRSKFGSSKLTRTWTRVLPRLHVRAFNLSFLRTRMFSTGEYCDRISPKPSIYFYF